MFLELYVFFRAYYAIGLSWIIARGFVNGFFIWAYLIDDPQMFFAEITEEY